MFGYFISEHLNVNFNLHPNWLLFDVHVYWCLLLGDMYETGADKGKYYSINVPLKDGIDDQSELCTV